MSEREIYVCRCPAYLYQAASGKGADDEAITRFAELAAWVELRLAVADGDFKIRRALIEAFGWRFTLVWRGAQRVVVVRWRAWEFDVEINY